MDWTKERATKNYCGYCTNSPPSASCDGSCFKDSLKNKIDHLETERNILEQRGKEIGNEFKKLLNEG